ncbi:MAG: orotidine-5'-phosphate decarboxylase [Acidimicrobiales bacterium]|jgi:orotidine-5'-phosphate decarboxylase
MTVVIEEAGIDVAAVRGRLALALDFESLRAAQSMARRLARYFDVVKIGLELFIAEGPAAVEALASDGFAVFLDLKLHDIPTTVGRAARRGREIGATYLTVHAAGGEAMLRAAVDGFAGGGGAVASGRGGGILGVTVLTSEPDAPAALLGERAAVAVRAGCVGLVCAAGDLAVVRAAAPELLAVVPGVRLGGSGRDDQARAATPAEAAAGGAGLLVIGRTVTAAADPEAAALAVALEVAGL